MTNAIGGAVTREVDADPESHAKDLGAIGFDLAVGAAGGAVGLKVKATYIGGKVGELERVSGGMLHEARRGDYGAARGRLGIGAKIGHLKIDAEVVATVAGSKTSDFAAPVGKELVKKKLEEE